MLLIVGLGNPGKKYQKTRHNIGSRVISELEALNLPNVILAKPTTFMNESGKFVKSAIKTYNLNPNNLIVIHDDIDLPLGGFKIQKNRGSAGHKGVRSIIDALGTKDFNRIRIGIKPNLKLKNQNEKLQFKIKNVENFVLDNFTKDEEKILKQVITSIIEKINELTSKF